MKQALTVSQLARAVHGEWRCAREREGWRFGPPDAAAKTSPYLKPIEAFSELEWRRERWLALTDLLAIAAHAPVCLASIELSPHALARVQGGDANHDIDDIARRAHAAWAAINRALGVADMRTALCFDELDADAKARCRANVGCDIAAIAALTQSCAPAPLAIVACNDMRADARLETLVLTAIRAASRSS